METLGGPHRGLIISPPLNSMLTKFNDAEGREQPLLGRRGNRQVSSRGDSEAPQVSQLREVWQGGALPLGDSARDKALMGALMRCKITVSVAVLMTGLVLGTTVTPGRAWAVVCANDPNAPNNGTARSPAAPA